MPKEPNQNSDKSKINLTNVNDEEDEELDTTFTLQSFEEQFYDDDGNWIEDKEETKK